MPLFYPDMLKFQRISIEQFNFVKLLLEHEMCHNNATVNFQHTDINHVWVKFGSRNYQRILPTRVLMFFTHFCLFFA